MQALQAALQPQLDRFAEAAKFFEQCKPDLSHLTAFDTGAIADTTEALKPVETLPEVIREEHQRDRELVEPHPWRERLLGGGVTLAVILIAELLLSLMG